MKLRWTRQTPTYWVADHHAAPTIKRWRHRESGRLYFTAFFFFGTDQWSAGFETLEGAKNGLQSLADAVGKGE